MYYLKKPDGSEVKPVIVLLEKARDGSEVKPVIVSITGERQRWQ